MLPDHHKTQQMGTALTFLQHYHVEEEDFLNKIVTGDETWVNFENEETKEQFSWILIPRVNQTSLSKPLSKCVWLLCSGTGKEFSWWNSWNVSRPSLQPHTMKRNAVIRHCPSWQCSTAHCNCNKYAPATFSMGSVWSHSIQPGLFSFWFSYICSHETLPRRTAFWQTTSCRPA